MKKSTPATIRFVHNGKGHSHLKELKQLVSGAEELIICIAYLRMSGFLLIESLLKKLIGSGAKVTICVGINQYITEPAALNKIYNALKSSGNAAAFIVRGEISTYHPKLYFARKPQGAMALIGSANITRDGMEKNTEASVLASFDHSSSLYRELEEFVSSVINSPDTVPMNIIAISQYQARYDIYNNRRKTADCESKKEVKELFEIDQVRLQKFLKEYLSDDDEAENLRQKTVNYRAAKKVLDRIAALKDPSKGQFMELYERLVGAEGGRKLWHSGSVYRSKNKVARYRKKVVALVKNLKTLIGKSPNLVYSDALSAMSGIPGLGPNVVTEILNTYSPNRYAVLNENPLGSLRKLGFSRFPHPSSFKAETYQEYCDLMKNLRDVCGLKSLSEIDHFMNYIYWKYVKK